MGEMSHRVTERPIRTPADRLAQLRAWANELKAGREEAIAKGAV